MTKTRREFLRETALATAGAATVPAFASSVLAAERPARTGKVLVILQLSGGNDGLSTVVPFEDDAYHRARPTLRIRKEQVLPLAGGVGFHPRMRGLKSLYDAGHVAVVQGVGYPRPSRSHFRSMEIWHTANPTERLDRCGWLGRWLAGRGGSTPPAAFIGNELPLALVMPRGQPTVLPNVASFRPLPDVMAGGDQAVRLAAIREVQGARRDAAANPTLAFLADAARSTLEASHRVQELARSYETPVAYPGPLGQRLRLVATLAAGGAGYEVFYVTHGGYDTHAHQYGTQANLLAQVSDALAAFFTDLKRQRRAGDVLVLAFSEFGRRVEENASRGTDHGTAGPVLLVSGAVKGGVYGAHPSLADLDKGDLKHAIDFRRVYATLLERWLGTAARPLLGGEFEPLPVL